MERAQSGRPVMNKTTAELDLDDAGMGFDGYVARVLGAGSRRATTHRSRAA